MTAIRPGTARQLLVDILHHKPDMAKPELELTYGVVLVAGRVTLHSAHGRVWLSMEALAAGTGSYREWTRGLRPHSGVRTRR